MSADKKFLTRQTLKIFWRHSNRYPLAITAIVVGLLVTNVAEVYKPLLYKRFFDLLGGSTPGTLRSLLMVVAYVFIVNGILWIFYRILEFSNNFFQPRVMTDLLNTCYEYLQKHSVGFFENSFVGSLVRRVTRYSSAFETIADRLTWDFSRILIRMSIILFVLLLYHWQIGVGVLVWIVIYVVLMYKFTMYKLPYDLQKSEADTEVTRHAADTITNHLNIKLFNGFGFEVGTFRTVTEKLYKLRKFTWDLGATVSAIQSGLILILEIAIMYYGVRLWQRGLFTIGDFALIQAYLTQIFELLWGIGNSIRYTYEAIADANEMTEILTTPLGIVDAPRAKVLAAPKGLIEFRKVGFAYQNNRKIFADFTFKIPAGQRVAIVGTSGGGKSTIVKLLFRYYDVQKGTVTIDGLDISKVTQDSLHETLSLVPQDPILFHRSLMENIRYAHPTATDDEVVAAAKAAHAHEFITNFSDGYNTLVGERGVKLSGGERQRVAIARAVLKNAPILVLDEATSSLDSESEMLIQDALKKLMKHKTVIVIAHRLSTIMQMDRIVVIDSGKIIEDGKHEELVKAKQGTYQKLWGIQAGGFS